MKAIFKFGLAAFVLMAFATSASAQKLGIDWGVIAGINMADYSVKQLDKTTRYDDVKNEIGWQAGLMMSINVMRFSIEPQIIYVRNKTELTEGNLTSTIKSNSLDVPILVSYRVLGPLRVMAGPVFTVMNDNSGIRDLSIDQLRSTCSYAVGLEARLFDKLRLDLRYNGQFKRKETAIGKVNVNTVAFNVGYYF